MMPREEFFLAVAPRYMTGGRRRAERLSHEAAGKSFETLPLGYPGQFLHPHCRTFQPVLAAGSARDRPAPLTDFRSHQSGQGVTHVSAAPAPRPQRQAYLHLRNSGGVVRLVPRERQDETFDWSATSHLFQLFRIASALHRDPGCSGVDVAEIVGREFDRGRTEVLF
jgi:hypothetical protein